MTGLTDSDMEFILEVRNVYVTHGGESVTARWARHEGRCYTDLPPFDGSAKRGWSPASGYLNEVIPWLGVMLSEGRHYDKTLILVKP